MSQKNSIKARSFVAFTIDFFISFIVFSFIVSIITHKKGSAGLSIAGNGAYAVFVLMYAYFFIFDKYLHGTIGKRLIVFPRKK